MFFGAWVTLEDEAGGQHVHRIVGPDEFDQAPDYISMDAPLARALMRKGLDDEVTHGAARRPAHVHHHWHSLRGSAGRRCDLQDDAPFGAARVETQDVFFEIANQEIAHGAGIPVEIGC